MKVMGVIAEYNPFHNGHLYQLSKIKQEGKADYIIVAMSGDFLQRGEAACMDKHSRAQMALSHGADLVLELPCIWATASAPYFAEAGVRLLEATGLVQSLCYGIETTNHPLWDAVLSILIEHKELLTPRIHDYQRKGFHYGQARAHALLDLLPQASEEELLTYLNQPNTILALEYEIALQKLREEGKSNLQSFPIIREGDSYHQKDFHSAYASATAIREHMWSKAPMEELSPYVPATTLTLLNQKKSQGLLLAPDCVSSMLYYKLRSYYSTGYETFADCTPDLSEKIKKNLPAYVNFTDFCLKLKTKDLTYTRISRVLCHILLDIKKEDYQAAIANNYNSYLRVLGFRRSAAPLLSQIKKHASLPIITKLADADPNLLDKDIFAADLYQSLLNQQSKAIQKNEYTQELIIL